jgi:hypothetical protein
METKRTNDGPINPREQTTGKNALGPAPHNAQPLQPHSHATDAQLVGVGKGGLSHATDSSVPGSNPLENPTGYPKAVALQTENVPNTVGARNRTANKE